MVDRRVSLETFTAGKLNDREIRAARKKVNFTFPDLPIWPGLADVGPETKFVGNPVTIRTADGQTYSARVDIPRGDSALPLTDRELMAKYRECAREVLEPEDVAASMDLLLRLESVENIRALTAILGARSAGLRG